METQSVDKSTLVKQFGTKISRLSHRMIFHNRLAQNAAQEVWFEILKSIDTFKGSSDIATWIYTISRRTILRFAKAERVLSGKEINDHFDLDQIEYTGVEEEKPQWIKEKCDYCLTAFCHCLTNEARLIFLFRDIAELSNTQISQIMELKEENIRKIASRSKEKVKHFMEKDCVLFFLDSSMLHTRERIFRQCLLGNIEYYIRIAGLLLDSSNVFNTPHCGIVYVARMREWMSESGKHKKFVLYGMEKLRTSIAHFDPWSRILINNLDSF